MIRNKPFVASLLAGLTLLIFLGLYNVSIINKERLLDHGQIMVLRLAPLDPRSLMQGDYMVLDFDAGRAIHQAVWQSEEAESSRRAVMEEIDGVWRFKRLYRGEDLASGERLLKFKLADRWTARISSGSYFFEEGRGQLYDRARFAELRVADDGTSLISGLLDENKRRISVEAADKDEG